MNRRQPPMSPLSLAQREADYQRAVEIAMIPTKPMRPRQSGLVGAVMHVFGRPADIAEATRDVYRRDISWRPLLAARESGIDADIPARAMAPLGGQRVTFTLSKTPRR